MDKSLFKRKEVKYLLNETVYRTLIDELIPYLEADAYPVYTICNLYFDTDDFDSVRTSMKKPEFKQKVRLRSYGIPTREHNVFLELKKKYRGIVYKRRICCTYADMLSYLKGGELPFINQSTKEIDYAIKYLDLSPKVYLAYDRIAYHGKDDATLRITFDYNIRYRMETAFSHDGGKIIESGYLLEIKTGMPYPRWLLDVLEKYKVFPCSYSKYSKVYEDILKNKMEKNL